MAFINLADVKSYLKITKTDYDSLLNSFIDDAEAVIENIINQPILQVGEVIKKLDIENGEYIILPYSVPTTVMSVSYNYPFESTIYTLTTPDDYEVFMDGYVQKIWIKNGVNEKYIWNISCSVGWALLNIPQTIIDIGIEMVAMNFKKSTVGESLLGKSSTGKSMSGTGINTSYKDLEKEWSKRLEKYKIYSI